jgi:hypothetical protein
VALASNGRGQGAIYHAGTRYLTTGDDPAMAGEAVDLTVRGLATQSVGLVRVSIGWRFATVQSVTTVADSTDLSIVRVRVPLGVAAGPAVQVRLFAMDRPSNDITMAVR